MIAYPIGPGIHNMSDFEINNIFFKIQSNNRTNLNIFSFFIFILLIRYCDKTWNSGSSVHTISVSLVLDFSIPMNLKCFRVLFRLWYLKLLQHSAWFTYIHIMFANRIKTAYTTLAFPQWRFLSTWNGLPNLLVTFNGIFFHRSCYKAYFYLFL